MHVFKTILSACANYHPISLGGSAEYCQTLLEWSAEYIIIVRKYEKMTKTNMQQSIAEHIMDLD